MLAGRREGKTISWPLFLQTIFALLSLPYLTLPPISADASSIVSSLVPYIPDVPYDTASQLCESQRQAAGAKLLGGKPTSLPLITPQSLVQEKRPYDDERTIYACPYA